MRGFGEIWQPIPRWVTLPGDPAPLRAWLRAQSATNAEKAADRDEPSRPDENCREGA